MTKKSLLLLFFFTIGIVSIKAQTAISRSDWQINATFPYDSGTATTGDGGAAWIIDEDANGAPNYNTWYHTDWSTNHGAVQGFMIDMGEVYEICQVHFEGRTTNGYKGLPTKYRLYAFEEAPFALSSISVAKISSSNTDLGTAISSGSLSWTSSTARQSTDISFSTTKARYVLFVWDAVTNNYPACSDFQVYKPERKPIDEYEEPRVGTTPDASEWGEITEGLHVSWASRDEQYSLHHVPDLKEKSDTTLYAWKGERANLEAVLFSNTDQGNLSVRFKDNTSWTEAGGTMSARFLNYVITDDYKACGTHDMSLIQWLAPDVIDQDKAHSVPAMETRPVWCSIQVPRDIEAGSYQATMEVVDENGQVVKTLNVTINVNSHTLPAVADQKFHLDLWQQPYAVSRYYGVDRWSDAHIEALRPYLKALAEAGQKVVSTILFYEPWGDQSFDKFSAMVQSTKKTDGTWTYDYTIFDKYVDLCAECGITQQINCYSMVPWDMTFRYYDEASGADVNLTTTTGSDDYKSLWVNFLTQFKAHLQEKGWFDKTCIAMDERKEADMLNAYAIADSIGFKMALAGNYHASLSEKLQDYCLAPSQLQYYTTSNRANRKQDNQITTFYTCCTEGEPNVFSSSLPAEATYLPLFAAANELDGYLHWSWINWAENPLTDTRFRLFGSGDTYMYYPGNRSSVRFERLIEGVQQFEKVQILKEEYENDSEQLAKLNQLLSWFSDFAVAGTDCARRVNTMEQFLNGVDVELPTPEDVTDGYYHIVSKATARTEHLFNNAFLSGNSNQFTLQSNTMVETNNGIWKVTVKSAKKLGLVNGDGHPMVAGASYAGAVVGTFSELTIGTTSDADSYRYYYFTECPNCTNGSSAWKVNGTDYITTWKEGAKTAADLLWRFEPVDVSDSYIYNVTIDGSADNYVSYTHAGKTENAFNGGFFITNNEITTSQLKAGILGNVVKSADISIEGKTITLSNVIGYDIPKRDTLFSTLKGGMDIPPYRIPGISCGKDGQLIATAARLVCGTDPGYGQVDVVCRLSDDNGKTWSEIKDVAVGDSTLINNEKTPMEAAYGDPAVVYDRAHDEVLVMAVGGCTVFTNSTTNRQNPNIIAAIRSLDGGKTWQTPEDQTEQIYSLYDNGNSLAAAFVGGGKLFQSRIVKKDKYYRLYAALAARPNGNRVIYSDDFGRTWKALGGDKALPAPNGDEPKCEELPDGRVVITSRVASGRWFNIFDYTNVEDGTGTWEGVTKCTFDGLSASPSSNPTNGEMLIVPATRNADGKELYVALQSIPTGSSRVNVGIFYKELADDADMKTITEFAADWDGFYQVSNTVSAYSSLDLQADGKIGFFYEETLTKWGTKQNPVSTSFPTGSGTHNYDGFENIYVPLELGLITNGKYEIRPVILTGINEVQTSSSNCSDSIYNLAGCKVSKVQKGVYIQNGKKFIR